MRGIGNWQASRAASQRSNDPFSVENAVKALSAYTPEELARAGEGSFLERYPYATASGYGGQKGILGGAPDIMSTDGNGMYGAGGHTRIASDEELYASQADIDAMRAQGRDITSAQQALDELWTRRYAGDDIPTLETVTAEIPEGYYGSGENAFDGALLGVRSWMGSVREDSRSIVDNADSPFMAAVGSGLYAINSVTDAVVSGFVDTGRLVTSSEQRGQFATGMKTLFTTNPLTTAGNAWGAWSSLPTEDRLRYGAAAIASLGAAPLSRGKELSELGDVADSTSQAAIRARVEANLAQSAASRASSNFDKFVQSEGGLYERLDIWPPNLGRIGPVEIVDLQPGSIIDRFGLPNGRFVAPQGTPFPARALPSSYEAAKPYFMYEVVKPIPGVVQSRALPWFGQSGMGVQFELPRGVNYLNPNNGYVRVRYHEP